MYNCAEFLKLDMSKRADIEEFTDFSLISSENKEAVMKKDILTNVGNLTGTLMGSVADAFDVNPDKIAAAFKFDLSEEELQRIMSAMMSSNEKKSAVSNLSQLGYQNIEEPTNKWE